MATTIARRIRRIGIMPSTYKTYENNGRSMTVRTQHFDPALTPEIKTEAATAIRTEHYARRDAAKKNPAPAKHRRCKSRKATAKKAA